MSGSWQKARPIADFWRSVRVSLKEKNVSQYFSQIDFQFRVNLTLIFSDYLDFQVEF